MSIFSAENVVVGGSSGSATYRVSDWINNAAYSDGQIVLFNGSQYIARGSVPAGVVPPIETATPMIPGQPKWQLACRGRSLPVDYSDTATYYADQVVLYLGGVFILDAATVPAGTRPGRDRRWTRQSETLTDAEGEKVTSADLSAFAVNTTAAIVGNTDETSRVRHHRVRLTVSGFLSTVALYTLRFPRPIPSVARPQITIQPEDAVAVYMLMTAVPVINGTNVTGYTLVSQGASTAGTYEFNVYVKEMIDQVK